MMYSLVNLLFSVSLKFLISVIGDITTWEEVHVYSLFSSSILFYLSAVGIGMWFSFGHKLSGKRNIFIWILFIISLTYIIAYQFFEKILQRLK